MASSAPTTTCGESNTMPFTPGYAWRIVFKQHAVTAADIDDRLEGREVVRLGHGRRDVRREAGHALVEDGRLVGVLAEIVEDRFAEDAVEGGAAGPDGFEQHGPRPASSSRSRR